MTSHYLSFYRHGLVCHLLTPGLLQELPNQVSLFPLTTPSTDCFHHGQCEPLNMGVITLVLHSELCTGSISVKPRSFWWPSNALHDQLAPNAFASLSPFPPTLPLTHPSVPHWPPCQPFKHSRHNFPLASSQVSLYLAPFLPLGLYWVVSSSVRLLCVWFFVSVFSVCLKPQEDENAGRIVMLGR